MKPLHLEIICKEDGVVTLRDLPIHKGDSIEVVLLRRSSSAMSRNSYPLRGEPVDYLRPFDPVAEGDWEAAR